MIHYKNRSYKIKKTKQIQNSNQVNMNIKVTNITKNKNNLKMKPYKEYSITNNK